MSFLFGSFLQGAVDQANSNLVAEKNAQMQRDAKRAEMLDSLNKYMAENDYKAALDEKYAIKKEGREKQTKIEDETRGLGIKKQEIDYKLGADKSLEGYKSQLDIGKDAHKMKQQLDMIKQLAGGGDFGGVVNTPAGDLSSIRDKEALAALAGADKAQKYFNVKGKQLEEQGKFASEPLHPMGGGDALKEVDDLFDKDRMQTEDRLFGKGNKLSMDEIDSKREYAKANVKQIANALLNQTRQTNEVTGVNTSVSKLNATDVKNTALDLEAALLKVESDNVPYEEKVKAKQDAYKILKDRDLLGSDFFNSPEMRTVLNPERRAKWNDIKAQQQATQEAVQPSNPAAAAPAPTDVVKTYKIRNPNVINPKTGKPLEGSATGTIGQIKAQGYEIIGE